VSVLVAKRLQEPFGLGVVASPPGGLRGEQAEVAVSGANLHAEGQPAPCLGEVAVLQVPPGGVELVLGPAVYPDDAGSQADQRQQDQHQEKAPQRPSPAWGLFGHDTRSTRKNQCGLFGVRWLDTALDVLLVLQSRA